MLAYYLLQDLEAALPYVLAVAASSFIYIAVADLIPTLHERAEVAVTVQQLALIAALVAMAAAHVARAADEGVTRVRVDLDLEQLGLVGEGAEGRIVEIDTDDEAGQRAYRERWEARRASLIKLANRLGVAVIPVQTTHDVHLSLMAGLELRARSRASL